MNVLILSLDDDHPNYAQNLRVSHWFREKGYKVIPFAKRQLERGKFDKYLLRDPENVIVYGSVSVVREALRRASRPMPPLIDYPDELDEYLGRIIDSCTYQDVIRGKYMPPFHLKPKKDHKLFPGTVIARLDDLDFLPEIDPETPVYVSEIRQFRSEWRATVLRRQVVNVSCYGGDPLVFPDPSILREALVKFKSAPIGYGIDWGVTDRGETLLMEVNDGFSLGNYGCRGNYYTEMIEARWRELMGLEDRAGDLKSLSV